MIDGISLNLNWEFKQGFDKDETGYCTIHLPHTVQEIPYDCFDQTMTCKISTYRKRFTLDDFDGKRILLTFEGVSAYYDLYVNGHKAGSHKGAYSMALFDITPYVHIGENTLVLMVDSHERNDIPPNGSTVDYLIYGGIYRDVDLYIKNPLYIRQLLARYEVGKNGITLFPELLLPLQETPGTFTLRMTVSDKDTVIYETQETALIGPDCEHICMTPRQLPEVRLWDTEDPALYQVAVEILDQDGTLIDKNEVRTGFRSVSVNADGFYLNGKKRKLIGLNRHQSYPYVGYAMGKRAQEEDAELLKEFLGLNMVRCSHYMQSKYFLDRCDELGLMVFEEIPGWGYIGGEEFRKVVFQDLKNMVLGHYNHPGIVIWGTRLNETTDCDSLYEETNRLCKEMDPSRPTSGVRWETGSRLIEDIYSYNDYTEDHKGDFMLLTAHQATQSPARLPYLVSEHTGAILPTKPWDSEERQEQFALRHARVVAKVNTMEDYLGALGWCMADYNTHNDHNSMNKVCYHGVTDMFRVPKWAAYFYASQKAPAQEVILEPCSMVGRGERCEPVPFFVMTNCDYIDVTLSTDITRRYYPSVIFNGLKHPPIEVTENGEFWQKRWEGARITGYINGKPAAEKIISNNPYLNELQMICGTGELLNDRVDETKVTVYFRDENGNRLYFHRGVVRVETRGEIFLIGPEYLPAGGGAVAFWIKTKASGITGSAYVTVTEMDGMKHSASLILELKKGEDGARFL